MKTIYRPFPLLAAFAAGCVVTLFSTGSLRMVWTPASSPSSVSSQQYPQIAQESTQHSTAETSPASAVKESNRPQNIDEYLVVKPGMGLAEAKQALYQYYNQAPSIPYKLHDTPAGEIIVVFDALCPKCHELYSLLATDANLKINSKWVPAIVFGNNESSVEINSSLTTMAMKDPRFASKMLSDFMGGNYESVYDHMEITPQAQHFVTKATTALLQAVDGVHGGGTPMVLYRDSSGDIKIIAEIPTIEQLLSAQPLES